MSNYNLSLTGAQVNSALNKVHNADTAPTDGSQNMITSDAVHDAIDDVLVELNNSVQQVQDSINRVFKEITSVGQASIATEDTFVDMPEHTIDIVANRPNRRFLLSGMLGLGARYAGSKFLFKWQYRKNDSGSWNDFTMPSNIGTNRIAGHFEYSNRMDNNTNLVGCLSYKVRTPQITHTDTDTINFKLVVANLTSDVDVHYNRATEDSVSDNDDRARTICQLEVEQL